MKKINIFGRQISAVLLGLILMAALASAGLLSYYGMITGTATVKQSVKLSEDGTTWLECTGGNYDNCKITYSIQSVAGNVTVKGPYHLKNDAPVPAKINFTTECAASTAGNNCDGITTTYQLVTTLFGKRGGTAEWTDAEAENGSYSVKMTIPSIPANTYNIGALVAIPIEPTTLENLDVNNMTFYVKGDCADDKPVYYQLKIDLGSDDYGRFVVVTPVDDNKVTSCSDWTQGTITTDSWYAWSFAGEGLEGPKSLSEWHQEFTDNDGVLDYPDYKVVEVDVQYGWHPNTNGGTVYVDTVTFQDQTWDLEPDNLQSVNLTNYPIDLYIGSDSEQRDFRIIHEFPINLIPDTYTITTKITPK
mgnify:CR=1 FL=1